jgi:LPS export ABC transporter protein LptC
MMTSRLLKRLLLAVAVVSLAAVVAVFVVYRQVTQHPEAVLEQLQKDADMHLKTIRQTATRNGIREWRLEAASATLMESTQSVSLTDPKVEFFMEDGDHVHLVADRGTISTQTSHMQVAGQVCATTSQYRFRTDALDYDPDSRQLRTDTPVTITGQAFTLKADTMVMNLKTNITRFEGGVEGTLSEDLQL